MQEKEQEFSFKSLFIPLTTFKAIHIIVLIGLIIYFACFFNSFIADDFTQIVTNSNIHSVANIPSLFTKGTSPYDSGQTNNFYRPILSTSYALIYLFSRDNPFGYHLIQVLMHIFNAIFIYLIFKYFFKKEISLMLSILFLIHPINTQSVVYIATLGENLFLFFGLFALYLTINKSNNFKTNFLISFMLLLSLLSKETGILFVFIILFFKYIYQKKNLLKSIIPSISILSIYLFLRIGVAHIYFNEGARIVPIQIISLTERIINIPKIIFYYLKTFFYPDNLVAFQSWVVKSLTLQDFFFPLLIDTIFVIIFIVMGVITYKKKHNLFKSYLFFLIWFLIGLSIIIQIFPLDETVSDNWFYFPMIGLLGISGVVMNSIDFKNKKRLLFCLLLIFFAISIIFSIRTIMRITNWYSQEALFTHDIKLNKDSHQLEGGLGDINYSMGKIDEAKFHYLRAIKIFPSQFTYINLGTFYLKIKDPKNAIYAYNMAIKYNRNIADAWGYLAIAKYHAGDKKGALVAAEKAYTLAPTKTFSTILDLIKNDHPIYLN